jgi:hypothetical protein
VTKEESYLKDIGTLDTDFTLASGSKIFHLRHVNELDQVARKRRTDVVNQIVALDSQRARTDAFRLSISFHDLKK